MKNKYKNLNAVMELLQDDFIEEALKEKKEKHLSLIFCKYAAAAACVLLLAGGLGWFLSNHVPHGDDNPKVFKVEKTRPEEGKDKDTEGKKEDIPAIQYEKNSRDEAELEKIPCDFQTADGGGGGAHGWLIIKSLEDMISKNPTRNNVESITWLPVFKNEKGLLRYSKIIESEYFDETDIYFDHLCYEETRDYFYNGKLGETRNICFQSDETKDMTDQLLEYTFYRMYGRGGEKKHWYGIMTPPSDMGKMYPLLSLEQAEQKLRQGEFFSHSPYDKDVAETAQVLSVELEYLTDEYHEYLQPFYKFLITDESWNLSSVMQCKNWEDYMSVSEVYVPAIRDEYLEIRESASLRTN